MKMSPEGPSKDIISQGDTTINIYDIIWTPIELGISRENSTKT